MLPSRQTPDLLLGSWSLIEGFGRVPRRLIWDNEAGIGRRGRLAAGVAEFCGTLATRVHQLKPRDPESKGVVERRNGFFETSFMPGRSFDSPADFNAQFAELAASGRTGVRCARSRPARSIWSTPTGQRCWRCRRSHRRSAGATRSGLGRDYYVRVDSNDYSVDPTAIGRQVTVTADLERVRVRLDGRARRRSRPGVGPPHDRHRPRPRRRPPSSCASSSAARARRRRRRARRATSPTTTAPSASTRRAGRVMAAKTASRLGRGQADPLPRRRVESTADHRSRRPARRPSPRRRLDP